MSSASRIKDSIRILGKIKELEYLSAPIASLDINHYTRPEDLFLKADQKRRKKKHKSSTKFEIKSKPVSDDQIISAAERNADEIVWLKTLIFCDSKLRVFINHDFVELARIRGEKFVTVCRFVSPIDPEERLAIILRKEAKSADFPTMARIEAIREAVDCYKWDYNTIRDVMVVKGRHKFSAVDIANEYRTAKTYEKFCNHETPTGGHMLSEFPETMSKIKFMHGTKEISESMVDNPTMQEYFVNMAIMTTVRGEPRWQDHIPAILKHPIPRKTLIEDRGGYLKALEELKALHPEVDKKTFPHYDFVSGNEKLKNPENQKLLKGLIDGNPEDNPTLSAIASSVGILSGMTAHALNKFMRVLASVNKDLMVRFVVRNYSDEVVAELHKFKSHIRRIK